MVTVPPIGEKFGVVIDDRGKIIGGATGYTDEDSAVIQKIVIDDVAQSEDSKGKPNSFSYIYFRKKRNKNCFC